MAAKDETPKDPERSYPWGSNTGTYKLWLTLITINILLVSVLFLVEVEIPLIADLTTPIGTEKGSLFGNATSGIFEPFSGPRGDDGSWDWTEYCIAVIVANIAIVWITKTVGKWVTSVEKWCKNLCTCKWYKPWCCLGKLFCWFVTVTKWVLYVVSVISSVVTSVLSYICIF